ncbi:site-specific recombinase, phage integrase family [Marvinbryantia formatexigens DSM 14469]|uniref:Site-specific recombinase, phage integrase family n=1 Tax=Marvinbryantia formatexigens DSM 14469 TaxID=478749 RepID=C6LJ05_9FIRM|nr:site-specific integrase [Marvinbryantia formatexigens]EET59325.1 site-specific recombinase, phage integrase family [Marvinbryantia formatexigens DSM 14469]UWO24401.1 site-specific integrase [Marvinbryantia formatexigens DSM 14469]SDF50160.1 Site-specific recombinase XerD [Marvinbryantia formatexigens]
MSEKRKDNKGRILRKGESQRKDLIYQYRYTDIRGKRQTVYSSDLKELREKEKEIQKQLDDGIDYAAGKITVIQLLERYISLKQGARYNTKAGYNFVLNLIKKEDFGYRQIRDIKVSDAQKWIMKLHSDGKGYSMITSVKGVVKPAFQMAYNEDIIRRNPFDFKLVDVVSNDSQKRIAMTDEQQKIWMNFIREDKTYCKYYDEFVVLLGTGMRVSEFCGLTKSDLDFENRRICVDHQLVRERGGKYYVEKTKTECGIRFIPMTDDVYQSLKNILANRRKMKKEIIVDGYSGFILIDKDCHPKVALHIENEMRWAMKKYKKLHPEQPFPHITPHVFRHTFCTNMANKGMDIKTLQYLMGYSDVGVTLNVYTHASYDRAAQQMAKIVDLSEQRGKFAACSGI